MQPAIKTLQALINHNPVQISDVKILKLLEAVEAVNPQTLQVLRQIFQVLQLPTLRSFQLFLPHTSRLLNNIFDINNLSSRRQ